MRNTPEAVLPNRSIKERLIKVGAYTGSVLASALMLGETPGLAATNGLASKDAAPTKIEKNFSKAKFIPYPPELNDGDILQQKDDIQIDALQTLTHKKEQWNGVIVLHNPTKYAGIGFTDSPKAYLNFAEPDWNFMGPDKNFSRDRSSQLVVTDPLLLKSKVGGHERLFALVYTNEGQPAYLDLKYAKDVGALTLYAYNDSKPRPMPVNTTTKMPNVIFEDKGHILDNRKANTGFVDSRVKLRYGHLSDIQPHM